MTKKAISATIDERLVRWIEEETKDGIRYRNKSHLVEIAVKMLKEKV